MLARLCTALVAGLIVSSSATAQVITGTLLERGAAISLSTSATSRCSPNQAKPSRRRLPMRMAVSR
jgi:hypothetical protein